MDSSWCGLQALGLPVACLWLACGLPVFCLLRMVRLVAVGCHCICCFRDALDVLIMQAKFGRSFGLLLLVFVLFWSMGT